MKKIDLKFIQNLCTTVSILLVTISCGTNSLEIPVKETGKKENIVELSPEQFELADIQIGKVEKRVMGTELNVNGVIDVPPQSNVSINMPYGGFVKYIDMLPGTKVKKGQLLVVIQNPEFIQFQQDYMEGLAIREFLKSDFERQEELYNEKVTSAKTYQQAKSAYMVNKVKIQTMQERLKLIGFNINNIESGLVSASVNIYSPVTGSVREVYSNLGDYVSPQDAIMDITDSEDLHVELTVFENDIHNVREGQQILFTQANYPNQLREAEVFLVGSGVREDRSVTVHGHLSQKYDNLLPGMYVSASIITDSQEVLAVPDEAVVRYNGKHYVFVLQSDISGRESQKTVHVFEMKEVKLGFKQQGYLQVSYQDSNEIVSDEIVLKGAYTLLGKAKNSEE